MVLPNDLNDIVELSNYIATHPVSGLNYTEIIDELGHWNTLCRKRYWEECRARTKNGSHISKANIVRVGCLIIELLSVPAHIVFPPIGLTLSLGGVGLSIYNEIEHFEETRRRRIVERPIDPVHQRCLALERELENRSAPP
jgi:hypothetical protein